jgi:phage terminase large subunit
MNPQSSEDPMSKRFLNPYMDKILRDGYYEDDLHLIVFINYKDNPWFPDSLEQERAWDFEHKPRAEYDHIWEGAFNDQVENSIILPEWFDAAIDAHVKLNYKPRGVKVVAHDPSDLGGDAKGMAYRHGVVFLDVQELNTGDVNEGCDWSIDYTHKVGADYYTWDGDGLGATLKRQINKSLPKIEHEMFKGSESPDNPDKIYMPADNDAPGNRRTNKETFRNKRAQYYWELRDRFYNTYRAINGEYVDPDDQISLSSDIKNLVKIRSELCRIPLVPNGSGRILIMGKPEMKNKHRIQSPNMADSIMMALSVKGVVKKKGPTPQPKIKVL